MLNEQGDAFYEVIDILLEEFHKNLNFDRNNCRRRGIEAIAPQPSTPQTFDFPPNLRLTRRLGTRSGQNSLTGAKQKRQHKETEGN
jgi:hypothetical protein